MDRFKELGIDTHGRTSGKMKTKCPWCHAQRTDKRDKSLSVNLDTKLYLCHYCGAHGSAAIYAGKGRKLGDPLVKFPTATGSNSSCPPTEKPHGDPEQGALTQKQIEWCRDVRHIPPEVLVEAGVAFASISMPISGKEKGWEKRDCLCFNFFENGELVNTKFRDSQKHFKLLQGARTIPYNINAIRDTPECILVEGEFDALSYMAVGRTDVISVPNGANSQLDWLDELSESHFEQKQVIYLSVDTDRKGRELCRELSRRLGVDRCRIVTYGEAYKDANELLVAEGPNALLKALEDAPIPRLEGTFTAEDLREGLHQLFEEGYTSGVELGIPNLDEIMRLETGRVLTVTGIPGHGKSDFVDEIVLRLCTRQDWRAGYFSPENTPIEYHHAKLAEKLLGHRFRKDFSTEEEFARVVDYLSQRVWHILPDGDFTLGNVLSKARELVHRHGIRVFVIDPYNYINHQIPAGMTETGYIGSFMNSLARFARLNSCLVILVAHPRKMNKQYGTQKTEVPTMYDINGSANFFNMTDYGIVVDRQDEMGIVYIHVEKTRFRNFGTKGNAAFCYDVTNGRYSPCTPPPEPGMQVQPWKGAKDLFSSEGWI